MVQVYAPQGLFNRPTTLNSFNWSCFLLHTKVAILRLLLFLTCWSFPKVMSNQDVVLSTKSIGKPTLCTAKVGLATGSPRFISYKHIYCIVFMCLFVFNNRIMVSFSRGMLSFMLYSVGRCWSRYVTEYLEVLNGTGERCKTYRAQTSIFLPSIRPAYVTYWNVQMSSNHRGYAPPE